MRGFLLNRPYDVTDTVCRIIPKQDMDMILVCFHRFDAVSVSLAYVENTLLQIIYEIPRKDLLSILRDKDDMHLKAELSAVMTIISVTAKFLFLSLTFIS